MMAMRGSAREIVPAFVYDEHAFAALRFDIHLNDRIAIELFVQGDAELGIRRAALHGSEAVNEGVEEMGPDFVNSQNGRAEDRGDGGTGPPWPALIVRRACSVRWSARCDTRTLVLI